MRMKALKTFRLSTTKEVTRPGAPEFDVPDAIGKSYEKRGLAVRVDGKSQKAERVRNKAADAGPLPSVGGPDGEETPASSSGAVRARRKPRSKK